MKLHPNRKRGIFLLIPMIVFLILGIIFYYYDTLLYHIFMFISVLHFVFIIVATHPKEERFAKNAILIYIAQSICVVVWFVSLVVLHNDILRWIMFCIMLFILLSVY